MIENVTGEPMAVRFREARSADVSVNVLEISRAVAELNWQPTTDMVAGLKQMFEQSVLEDLDLLRRLGYGRAEMAAVERMMGK